MANGGTATSATLQVVLKAVDQFTPIIQQARAELARFKATTQQVLVTATRPYTQATKQATQAVREQSQILYVVDRYGGITAKTLSQEVAPAQEEVAKKTEDATRAFRRHKQQISELQRFYMMFKNILISMFIYFALRPLLFGLQQLITNYAEQEEALFRLSAVLKSTGFAARATAMELVDFAEALQRQTIFSDEAIERVEAILLTFTKLKAPVLKDATKAVLDMSAALGTDLQTAAIRVGKALQDPIYGVTALRRVGVNLDDQTKELIRTLFKQGKVMEAQRIILDELETEFGGMANMLAATLPGAARKFKNAFGDVLERIGDTINRVTALNERLYLMARRMEILNKQAELFRQGWFATAESAALNMMVEGIETIAGLFAESKEACQALGIEFSENKNTVDDVIGGLVSGTREINEWSARARKLYDIFDDIIPVIDTIRSKYKDQISILERARTIGEVTKEDKEKIASIDAEIADLEARVYDWERQLYNLGKEHLDKLGRLRLQYAIEEVLAVREQLKMRAEHLKIQTGIVDKLEEETEQTEELVDLYSRWRTLMNDIKTSIDDTLLSQYKQTEYYTVQTKALELIQAFHMWIETKNIGWLQVMQRIVDEYPKLNEQIDASIVPAEKFYGIWQAIHRLMKETYELPSRYLIPSGAYPQPPEQIIPGRIRWFGGEMLIPYEVGAKTGEQMKVIVRKAISGAIDEGSEEGFDFASRFATLFSNSFADMLADAVTTGIFEGFQNVELRFEDIMKLIMREAISLGIRLMLMSALGIKGAQEGAYITRPSIIRVAEREPEYIIPLSKMAKFMQPVVYLKIETRDPSTWVQSWDKRTILVLERKLRRGA